MKSLLRALALGVVFVLLPSLGLAETDRREMDEWCAASIIFAGVLPHR
jgi:hypothetical protein